MLVKYNRPNNHVLASTTAADPVTGVMAMPVLHILRPGWNEFPSDVIDSYKKDKEFSKFIDDGVIEFSDAVMKEKVGKKTVLVPVSEGDAEVHLAKIDDEKKCIEIVKGTLNRDLLQRWLDEETRSKVKRALEKQMEQFKPKSA